MASSATAFFQKRVADHAKPYAALGPDSLLRDVVGLMATGKHSAVVIADGDNRPVGIVTEQDIVRRATFNADAAQPAADLMTRPVLTVGTQDRLFIAIARMRRLGHRHMPVIDGDGRLAGLLDLHEAMTVAAEDLVGRIDSLAREDSVDGLRETKAAQVDLATDLFEDGVAAIEIQTLLTEINADIYRRLTNIGITAMAAAGKGAPPVPFSVIVMGSGGRGENLLYPDQDYGFVFDDYPEARKDEIDGWFVGLAERLSIDLDAVGIPFCTGNVMATNPLWRKSIAHWVDQVDDWNARCFSATLLEFDIFFDFVPVWGDPSNAQVLRRHATEVLRGNQPFLRALFHTDRDHGTALRAFGRFATERDKPDHRGKVNLKLYGTLPLVSGVRMLTLREGIDETGTLARLEALLAAEALKRDEHDALDGAYRTLCELLLRQQIADVKDGLPASSYVHPKSLTRRERDELRAAFRAIDDLRKRINFELGGEIF